MKLLRSQAGFTITELVVSIALSGFLMAVAATGFSAFFTKFADLNSTIELHRDAFNCLQAIKNGIPIGSGTNLKFSGVSTANSVKFGGLSTATSGREIILYPPVTSVDHAGDYVRIFYDNSKYIRYSYVNGSISTPSPKYLFPQPTRGNKTTVTGLLFSKANLDETTYVVSVTLNAKVEVAKIPKVNRKQYKYVTYTTKMTIAMK